MGETKQTNNWGNHLVSIHKQFYQLSHVMFSPFISEFWLQLGQLGILGGPRTALSHGLCLLAGSLSGSSQFVRSGLAHPNCNWTSPTTELTGMNEATYEVG